MAGGPAGVDVTTGPATTYWNPANAARGNYNVQATFTEFRYMNVNDHPHPYGMVIAGNDRGTDKQSLFHCTAYGNGSYIVRSCGERHHDDEGVAPSRF